MPQSKVRWGAHAAARSRDHGQISSERRKGDGRPCGKVCRRWRSDNGAVLGYENDIGHCQNNCKASALDEEDVHLSGTELAPLGESGGAVPLEMFAAVVMALLIEMIVHG